MQALRTLLGLALIASCDRAGASTSPEDGEPSQSAPAAASMESAPKQEVDTEIEIKGPLKHAQVQAVVDQHFDPVRTCFDEAMARMEMNDLSGVISVEMTIDASGAVTLAQLHASNFGDPEAADCLVELTRSWTFPKLRKGATARVIYPFQLRSY